MMKRNKRSKFPHIDAMTSSELDVHLISDGITPEEYKYTMKRLKQAAKS
jgi:hypothetical protein